MKHNNANTPRRRSARLRPLMVALCAAGFAQAALAGLVADNALPQVFVQEGLVNGVNVVRGNANVVVNGNNMQIDQHSRNAFLEAYSFNVGSAASFKVNSDFTNGLTLARVTGFAQKSYLEGAVSANNHFVLVNPYGIYVGGSVLTTGSITLAAKDLDPKLIENNYQALDDGAHLVFNTNVGNGYGDPTVEIAQGAQLTAGDGGSIFLIADRVINRGAITTGLIGQIKLMAAGFTEVELGDSGFIKLVAANAGTQGADRYVENFGTIRTDGGSVSLTAYGSGSFINHYGVIDVSSAAGKGGDITLSADDVYVGAGDGDSNAKLLADGATGGGVIEINNATVSGSIESSSYITVDSTAELSASAINSGDGGLIRLSTFTGLTLDEISANNNFGSLQAFGKLSARGGANGGNGGTVEMAAHNVVTREEGRGAVTVDVSAGGPAGAGGLWSLYSPNLTIGSQTLGPNFSSATTYVNQTDINNVLNTGSSVSLSTSYQNSSQVAGGDLNIEGGTQLIRSAGTGTNTLFLQSSNDIVVGAGTSITSTSGKMNVVMLADADGNGVGSVRMQGVLSLRDLLIPQRGMVRPQLVEGDNPVTINSNGGDVLISGAQGSMTTLPNAEPTSYAGVSMVGTEINTQGSDGARGNVTIKGAGGGSDGEGSGNSGVYIDSSNVTAGSTSIIGFSAGDSGVNLNRTTISTSNQLVSINGVSTAVGSGSPTGVNIGTGVVINMGQGGAKILGLADGKDAVGVHIADLLLTTAPPSAGVRPTFTLVGESRGSSGQGILAEGTAIRMQTQGSTVVASADVIVGATADKTLAPSAMELGTPRWNTTGRINFRPMGLSLDNDQLSITESLDSAIRVGSSNANPASNFLVRPEWFVGAGSTADNPDVTQIVIGSSGHTGLISVDAGALQGAGPVSLQNQGDGSQGIALEAQSMAKQTLNLVTTGDVTQTGPLSVNVLNVIAGPQSKVLLNNAGNRINILASSGVSDAAVSSVATPSAAGAQAIAGFSSVNNNFEQLDISYTRMVLPPIPRPFEGPDALSELRTDVYVKGQFGKPQICTPANTTGAAVGGASDIEPLSQEWSKVRRGAQLTNCSGVQADSNCSAF